MLWKVPVMKESRAITLALITGTLFLECEEKARNPYCSWDDCGKDYKELKDCKEKNKKDSAPVYNTVSSATKSPSVISSSASR